MHPFDRGLRRETGRRPRSRSPRARSAKAKKVLAARSLEKISLMRLAYLEEPSRFLEALEGRGAQAKQAKARPVWVDSVVVAAAKAPKKREVRSAPRPPAEPPRRSRPASAQTHFPEFPEKTSCPGQYLCESYICS